MEGTFIGLLYNNNKINGKIKRNNQNLIHVITTFKLTVYFNIHHARVIDSTLVFTHEICHNDDIKEIYEIKQRINHIN